MENDCRDMRVIHANSTPVSPPAIWTAFARQAAWKNWVILLQLGIMALLAAAAIGLAHKEPDVVLVSPDGKSTYLSRSMAGDALTQFLAEQKHQPSDVTVVHFTRDFLNAFLAVNSSTIDLAWRAALEMMSPQLRAQMMREALAQKLLETYKVAQVSTELSFEDILLVERHESALHVRARVLRRRAPLAEPTTQSVDRMVLELIEAVVARTPSHPDGLEVVEVRTKVLADDVPSPKSNEVAAHVH